MVWGWDAAITEALYLADLCAHVHIFVRWTTLRAEKVWVDQLMKRENVTLHYETQISRILGQWSVESVEFTNGKTMQLNWIFIAVGSDPDTRVIDYLLPKKDATWCIEVDARQATSIPGIYAAGDVTTNSNKFKQTIMSAAEWCLAAHSIHEDILKWL